MTKKKIIAFILIVIALILVGIGIVLSLKKSREYELTPPNTIERTSYTIEDAIEMSKLYENDNSIVEVSPSEDGNYQIIVKDKETSSVINTFIMDKKTGTVSELPQTDTIIINSYSAENAQ